MNTNISWAPHWHPQAILLATFQRSGLSNAQKPILQSLAFVSQHSERKLLNEIASNEPTSSEASELLEPPLSILEVSSGSILHLDTGNPNTCYAIFFGIPVLNLPTGGGRSVGIVRSRTKATEFFFIPVDARSLPHLSYHSQPPFLPSDTTNTRS